MWCINKYIIIVICSVFGGLLGSLNAESKKIDNLDISASKSFVSVCVVEILANKKTISTDLIGNYSDVDPFIKESILGHLGVGKVLFIYEEFPNKESFKTLRVINERWDSFIRDTQIKEGGKFEIEILIDFLTEL